MLLCIQLPAALNTLQADRKYIATRLIKVSARHSANTSASTKAQTQAELSASPARMKALQLPSGTDLDALADEAIVWASQHGLVYGFGDSGCEAALIHAPIAVLPSPFPRDSFDKARRAMQLFNQVTDRITQNSDYLQQTLASAAAQDDFTAKLLEIYKSNLALRQQRALQQVVLAINRSDYMMDEPSHRLLQVELNTIASSFGALSTLLSQMHRYILQRASAPTEEASLPPNNVTAEIADAIAAAVHAYAVEGAIVLMVVQPGEKNSYDQQWIQLALWERHRIRTLRKSLIDIHNQAHLNEHSGQLSIGGCPVGVAYFRAGYSPADYPTDAEWQARDLLERSTAALCPSVAYQLAGAKKIQQDLAQPGILSRFVDSPEDAQLLQACFAGLWGLDNLEEPETKGILQQATDQPEAFVLKPQREGGGNNLYGQQLLDKLSTGTDLAAYILMQRIRPPIQPTLIARHGEPVQIDSLSELGIFGTFVRKGDEVLLNKEAGHLVRTKAATSDEGGVAAGFAVLDSPFLTP